MIHDALPKLLPGAGGALYVSRRDDAGLDLQVSWGAVSAEQSFSAEDCWALRRGRPHVYDPASCRRRLPFEPQVHESAESPAGLRQGAKITA